MERDQEERRTKMLLVDPESNFRMMIRCTKEKDIEVFLKKEYDGKLELEASSKCMRFKDAIRVIVSMIRGALGMINGLRFLHIHEIRHEKLKLHNMFIKDNYVAQLAGLANTDWPDEEKELREEDEEVRDLLSKVLQKDYNLRPTLEEILGHPIFFDWQRRIELLTELSDFCHLKRRVGHPVIEHLDNIVGPEVFGTSWKGKFDDDVLEEVTRQRLAGKPSTQKKVKSHRKNYDYGKIKLHLLSGSLEYQ
ncbi:serine/threonine-protein kinase/endoribonuclease IRE1b-like protein [Tanacetum coccineum]